MRIPVAVKMTDPVSTLVQYRSNLERACCVQPAARLAQAHPWHVAEPDGAHAVGLASQKDAKGVSAQKVCGLSGSACDHGRAQVEAACVQLAPLRVRCNFSARLKPAPATSGPCFSQRRKTSSAHGFVGSFGREKGSEHLLPSVPRTGPTRIRPSRAEAQLPAQRKTQLQPCAPFDPMANVPVPWMSALTTRLTTTCLQLRLHCFQSMPGELTGTAHVVPLSAGQVVPRV